MPRRAVAIVGLVPLSLVVVAFTGSLTSLRRLRDAGGPFDVVEFPSVRVRDVATASIVLR